MIVLAVASHLFGSADVSLKDLVRFLSHHDDQELSAIVFDIQCLGGSKLLVGAALFCCYLCLAGW